MQLKHLIINSSQKIQNYTSQLRIETKWGCCPHKENHWYLKTRTELTLNATLLWWLRKIEKGRTQLSFEMTVVSSSRWSKTSWLVKLTKENLSTKSTLLSSKSLQPPRVPVVPKGHRAGSKECSIMNEQFIYLIIFQWSIDFFIPLSSEFIVKFNSLIYLYHKLNIPIIFIINMNNFKSFWDYFMFFCLKFRVIDFYQSLIYLIYFFM